MSYITNSEVSRTGARLRLLAWCCLAMIVALLVVGCVSHGVLRHIVQTAPLWAGVMLGLRRSELAKWITLPLFLFWGALMTLIWLFLLGWSHLVNGHFSVAEILMTFAVGAAAVLGFVVGLSTRTGVKPAMAVLSFAGSLLVQLLAFGLSLSPAIAHR